MQLTESSIFINLKALRRRIYTAQFMMTKADRIIYGTPLMESCGRALGARLNESKFYCQHYTKGVEWIGSHIKMDRIYPNNRIIRRGRKKAKALNRRIDRAHVEHLLSSVNSYLGLCKNLNGFSAAVSILKCLSEKWREYVTLNRRRVCLQALPDYTYRNRIIYNFNLK